MLNALNLAEHRYGSARGRRNVILVHTTLGIGASLLVDGAVVRGQGMQAGQIAHARVSGTNLACSCGRRGCLTTVASGHAVLRGLDLVPKSSADPVRRLERELDLLARVLERAQRHHEPSLGAVLNAGRSLGRFLGTAAAFASPDAIILGGRLGVHANYIWGVREGLREILPAARVPEVGATAIGSDNAAAMLAVEDLVCAQPLEIGRLAAVRVRRRRAAAAPLKRGRPRD
jgi:predicted NBD/HSP70 family sugar kinase